jgi:hypothetical protein
MVVELTTTVLNEVYKERRRQDRLWGVQDHPDGTSLRNGNDADRVKVICEETRRIFGVPTWMHILQEEAWEAFAEEDPKEIRAELVQVAAVAVAWIEAIDRRGK